jgi:hypothetical protein
MPVYVCTLNMNFVEPRHGEVGVIGTGESLEQRPVQALQDFYKRLKISPRKGKHE